MSRGDRPVVPTVSIQIMYIYGRLTLFRITGEQLSPR
jgi:hypothetical protein